MKRQFDPAEPELMDRPQPVSSELEKDLRNIRQLNRFFGSHRLILHFLRRWIKPGDHVRIVDLGTGSGDIPRLLIDYGENIAVEIEIDMLYLQSTALQVEIQYNRSYAPVPHLDTNIIKSRNA